jgi:hypothetical protein
MIAGTRVQRREALAWAVGIGCSTRSVAQQALAAPTGAAVLSIGGRVQRTNQGERAVFDMTMLQAMPQHSFSTKTPWFSQARKFTGPLLRDLLAMVGASGATLRLGALNDYRIDVPTDDARRYDVMLARLIDDRPITVREKGPLFMIYPFDSDAGLRNALYYSRSVWQLATIDVM